MVRRTTINLDSELVAEAREVLKTKNTGALADAIEAVMRANPEGIAGAERWIAPLSVAKR